MTRWLETLLASQPLRAEVRFAGTLCGGDGPLHPWPGGCLHFVRSGRCELVRPAHDALVVDAPAVLYLPAGGLHRLCAAEGGAIDVVCALLDCDAAFTQAAARALPPVLVLPLGPHGTLRHTLDAFFAEALTPGARGQFLERQLCAAVLVQLLRPADAAPAAPARDPRIATALAALERGFADPALDLATLAAAAGMSRSRFAEHFRTATGESPHRYLQRHRIGVAQRLLADGLAVKVVAYRVGFRTASAFCAAFRQRTGHAPAAWVRGTPATRNGTLPTPAAAAGGHNAAVFQPTVSAQENAP